MDQIQQAAMCSQTTSLLRSFSCGFLDRLTTLEWKRNWFTYLCRKREAIKILTIIIPLSVLCSNWERSYITRTLLFFRLKKKDDFSLLHFILMAFFCQGNYAFIYQWVVSLSWRCDLMTHVIVPYLKFSSYSNEK